MYVTMIIILPKISQTIKIREKLKKRDSLMTAKAFDTNTVMKPLSTFVQQLNDQLKEQAK